MDFDFAPTCNRVQESDLVVYMSQNPNSRDGNGREYAVSCNFSSSIAQQLGWQKGDRLVAKWSDKDKTFTFTRVGIDDPTPAYKVTFRESQAKKRPRRRPSAHVRLGCPIEIVKSIVGDGERRVFSFFEQAGNKALFVST
jgi:hypothetical protein